MATCSPELQILGRCSGRQDWGVGGEEQIITAGMLKKMETLWQKTRIITPRNTSDVVRDKGEWVSTHLR